MCVILDKNPGAEIPFEKILSASIRNNDGYGLIIIDRDKLEVVKGLTTKPGATADLIAKRMEDAKDQRVVAHLRLKTHGAIDEQNLHPFKVLDHDDYGTELWLMHNGVLSDFTSFTRTEEQSDTAIFVNDIVSPLAIALASQNGPEALLDDALFKRVLSKYAGSSNKLSLIDNKGKVLHINEAGGKRFDWGWASNEYSFTPKPSPRDYEDAGRAAPVRLLPAPSGSSSKTPQLPTGINEKASEVVSSSVNTTDSIRDYAPANRIDICTVLDINGLEELHCLDEYQWLRIVKEEPEVAVLALLDLTYFHYQTMQRIKEGMAN